MIEIKSPFAEEILLSISKMSEFHPEEKFQKIGIASKAERTRSLRTLRARIIL
jgi:hypothetical protein